MPGPEFFQTVMGKRFFEGTMPRIANSLQRIAMALEAIERRAGEDFSGGGCYDRNHQGLGRAIDKAANQQPILPDGDLGQDVAALVSFLTRFTASPPPGDAAPE